MDASSRTKDARLNMEHGFMKSIIKNQLDRASYDKESPQGVPVRPRRTRAAARRPDRAIYTPPVGRGSVAPPRAVLFKFEYCDSRSGAVCQQPFVEGTDLAEFCASFAKKAGLDARQQRALEERLRSEVSPPDQ